jgi:hypothetical protein
VKLNECMLCERLATSRAPSSEALRVLAGEGLIDIVPNLLLVNLVNQPLADRFVIGAATIDYGPVLLLMSFGFRLATHTLAA